MILAYGKVYDSARQDDILENLESEINRTLAEEATGTVLDREKVITAIDTLGQKIASGAFTEYINKFLPENASDYLSFVTEVMKAENLRYRLERELGAEFKETEEISPPYGIGRANVRMIPLGTLFHIAAGNMDGLPAFTVIEGLLTGNINILKLPQADNGLTIEIFRQLIAIEPTLAPYIYVFDTPSTDVIAISKMAALADGIVVWGGDEAVKAVRTMAPTGAKLIEWGHKLGFAYLSGYEELKEEEKKAECSALAKHIMDTKQLLCSSCQIIYIDTGEMDEVYAFCKEFLPYLEAAAQQNPVTEIGAVAEISLRRYCGRLEEFLQKQSDKGGIGTLENNVDGANSPRRVYQGAQCSLTACADSNLELSYMYGNVLVKPLPEEELITVLRKSKGYLQTAGLICIGEKRERLTEKLIYSGVNRVMTTGNMSASFCGEAHDGDYPLRRYLRVVNVEGK